MMRKIGVVSAKGGSGKTTISLSLAFSLAEEGKKAMKFIDAAIIVSLPDELGMRDAQRCLSVLSHFNIPVIGYILNMTSFKCECGREIQIFPRSSLSLPVPKLGEVPITLNHSLIRLPFSSQILTLPAQRPRRKRRILSLLKLVSGRWSM